MFDLVDALLRDVILGAAIPGLTLDAQIRFQPPDATLRADVLNLDRRVLCAYLVDLREHRKLRSNERFTTRLADEIVALPAPPRVDCHYLISAWTPTQAAPGVEPVLEEHDLLYRASEVLFREGSLRPSRVYAPLSAKLLAWPALFQNDELPATVLPAEGFAKLSEFWTTMGPNSPWKPCVYWVITVPVALIREIQGPPVTTTITDHRFWEGPGVPNVEGDVWAQIGGRVLDLTKLVNGQPVPLPGAWVLLENLVGDILKTATADADGRFIFTRLQRGTQYQLRAGVVNRGQQSRLIDVPSPTGEYELRFP
jgi:uncharacterized protein DUF4255